MARKDVPLEKNWKHWKEKYEMECHARERDKESTDRDIRMWMLQSITLGRAIDVLLRSFN